MVKVGYHASHEQFAPRELLEYVQLAERAGFSVAMCSDHYYPWSDRQGQSGFAWSWLGAALQATTLPFGVVSTPGWRYHPAVLAQAGATLAQMYPGRFWVALGSGEALNEHITGQRWPAKAERNQQLHESVTVIRALWAGETVSHQGLVRVEEARLYTQPDSPPPIIGAALTPETARWLGSWADGLITVNKPREELQQIVGAFRDGGGDGKPIYLQVHLSYARSEDEAYANAHDQWRTNAMPSAVLAELRLPAQFDAATAHIRPTDLVPSLRISNDVQRHLAWLQDDVEQGFSQLYLHNVGRNQREFIDVFGEHIVPMLTPA
jgi:coenzyme F420-dependent glucose-6-phosphate dehydrogenase